MKLVVNGGTATGTTSLDISNVGGPGAETTGNGILVVNAINGAMAAGAFTLDNPELRAGGFDYRLFQGGINGTDPNDWFLRSSFIVGRRRQGRSPSRAGAQLAGRPTAGCLSDHRARVGDLRRGSAIARQMGLTTLGTLHERIGDALASDPCQAAAVVDTGSTMYRKAPIAPAGCAPTWSGWVPSVWARGFGQKSPIIIRRSPTRGPTAVSREFRAGPICGAARSFLGVATRLASFSPTATPISM